MKKSTPIGSGHAAVIANRIRKKPPVLISLDGWLKDAKEEAFAILICDGIPLAIAYARAGFDAANKDHSAMHLYKAPRIQARCQAILQARASQPPIALPEVTDMLKRVYVGAIHDTEYNAAHNAAFSLARLHGLVVDRAQLDVIRRPSREPDAPAELALSDWIQQLPGPGPQPIAVSVVRPEPYNQGPIIEASSFGCDLDGGPDGIENGAPTRPVTGTPSPGAHFAHGASGSGDGTRTTLSTSFLHDPIHPPPHSEIGSPFGDQGTGILPGASAQAPKQPEQLPSAEDLF